MYGAIYDWHTVEGASVRRHQSKYYCFFSAGAWERESYGVSYVIADHPSGPYYRPAAANEPLLSSVPGSVIGPGHNSFTETPDGQEIMIYHAWDPSMTARLMRIDLLLWANERPLIQGPTWTPQSASWLNHNESTS